MRVGRFAYAGLLGGGIGLATVMWASGCTTDGGAMEAEYIQRDSGPSYGSFAIMDEPEGMPDFPGGSCAEPMVNERIVFMCTSAEDNAVAVTVASYAHLPGPSEAGWSEVFDVTVTSRTGLHFWAGGSERWPGIERQLSASGPGHYHVRIHANGRAENEAAWPAAPANEEYLVQVWPTGR